MSSISFGWCLFFFFAYLESDTHCGGLETHQNATQMCTISSEFIDLKIHNFPEPSKKKRSNHSKVKLCVRTKDIDGKQFTFKRATTIPKRAWMKMESFSGSFAERVHWLELIWFERVRRFTIPHYTTYFLIRVSRSSTEARCVLCGSFSYPSPTQAMRSERENHYIRSIFEQGLEMCVRAMRMRNEIIKRATHVKREENPSVPMCISWIWIFVFELNKHMSTWHTIVHKIQLCKWIMFVHSTFWLACTATAPTIHIEFGGKIHLRCDWSVSTNVKH